MQLLICPLASGSSGNCLYVGAGDTHLLVDAGISASRALASLSSIGMPGSAISGLLITHEHSDHISGAGALSRKLDIPIYATRGTWDAMRPKLGNLPPKNMRELLPGQDFYLGNLNVLPFDIPHDAAQPVGYSFTLGALKFTSATDIGHISKGWMAAAVGSQLMLLESNHDPDMLRGGPYPAHLKRRILSRIGHLSNEDAGRALCALHESGVRDVILGHLSAENNTPDLAYDTVTQTLREGGIDEKRLGVHLAERDHAMRMFALE